MQSAGRMVIRFIKEASLILSRAQFADVLNCRLRADFVAGTIRGF